VAKKLSSGKLRSSGGKKKPRVSLARRARKASKPPAKIAKVKAAAPRLKRFKTPLTKPELREFRGMLLEKRRSLVGDMSGIQAEALKKNRQDGAGDLSNMPTHPADIGTDNYEHEFTLELLESERTLLKEIDQALERIDQGSYGICLGTGQFIGKARLKARPWAKYCIEYAKLVEKGLVKPEQSHPDSSESEDEADAEEEPREESEAEEAEEAPETEVIVEEDEE